MHIILIPWLGLFQQVIFGWHSDFLGKRSSRTFAVGVSQNVEWDVVLDSQVTSDFHGRQLCYCRRPNADRGRQAGGKFGRFAR